jgi:hypothetical protein
MAVFAPVAMIVPTTAFPPAIPLTSQVMIEPAATQKFAVNDCELVRATFADPGETEFDEAHVTVMLALANFEMSAMLVAVTLIGSVAGGTAGAV